MSLSFLSSAQNLPVTNKSDNEGETALTSSNDNNLTGTTIFPNPVHLTMIVSIPQFIPSDISFVFYSIYGKKIDEGLITNSKFEIDVSTYPAGLYILFIKGSQSVEVKRIIKE